MEITIRTNDISRYKRTQDATIVYTKEKAYVCEKWQKIDFSEVATTLSLKEKRHGEK